METEKKLFQNFSILKKVKNTHLKKNNKYIYKMTIKKIIKVRKILNSLFFMFFYILSLICVKVIYVIMHYIFAPEFIIAQ